MTEAGTRVPITEKFRRFWTSLTRPQAATLQPMASNLPTSPSSLSSSERFRSGSLMTVRQTETSSLMDRRSTGPVGLIIPSTATPGNTGTLYSRVVEFSQERKGKNEAPRFEGGLDKEYRIVASTVCEDEQIADGDANALLLHCFVQTNVQDVVFLWSKDSCEIYPSKRIRIISQSRATLLRINYPKVVDSGLYSCKAYNPEGTCETVSRVIVTEPTVPEVTDQKSPSVESVGEDSVADAAFRRNSSSMSRMSRSSSLLVSDSRRSKRIKNGESLIDRLRQLAASETDDHASKHPLRSPPILSPMSAAPDMTDRIPGIGSLSKVRRPGSSSSSPVDTPDEADTITSNSDSGSQTDFRTLPECDQPIKHDGTILKRTNSMPVRFPYRSRVTRKGKQPSNKSENVSRTKQTNQKSPQKRNRSTTNAVDRTRRKDVGHLRSDWAANRDSKVDDLPSDLVTFTTRRKKPEFFSVRDKPNKPFDFRVEQLTASEDKFQPSTDSNKNQNDTSQLTAGREKEFQLQAIKTNASHRKTSEELSVETRHPQRLFTSNAMVNLDSPKRRTPTGQKTTRIKSPKTKMAKSTGKTVHDSMLFMVHNGLPDDNAAGLDNAIPFTVQPDSERDSLVLTPVTLSSQSDATPIDLSPNSLHFHLDDASRKLLSTTVNKSIESVADYLPPGSQAHGSDIQKTDEKMVEDNPHPDDKQVGEEKSLIEEISPVDHISGPTKSKTMTSLPEKPQSPKSPAGKDWFKRLANFFQKRPNRLNDASKSRSASVSSLLYSRVSTPSGDERDRRGTHDYSRVTPSSPISPPPTPTQTKPSILPSLTTIVPVATEAATSATTTTTKTTTTSMTITTPMPTTAAVTATAAVVTATKATPARPQTPTPQPSTTTTTTTTTITTTRETPAKATTAVAGAAALAIKATTTTEAETVVSTTIPPSGTIPAKKSKKDVNVPTMDVQEASEKTTMSMSRNNTVSRHQPQPRGNGSNVSSMPTQQTKQQKQQQQQPQKQQQQQQQPQQQQQQQQKQQQQQRHKLQRQQQIIDQNGLPAGYVKQAIKHLENRMTPSGTPNALMRSQTTKPLRPVSPGSVIEMASKFGNNNQDSDNKVDHDSDNNSQIIVKSTSTSSMSNNNTKKVISSGTWSSRSNRNNNDGRNSNKINAMNDGNRSVRLTKNESKPVEVQAVKRRSFVDLPGAARADVDEVTFDSKKSSGRNSVTEPISPVAIRSLTDMPIVDQVTKKTQEHTERPEITPVMITKRPKPAPSLLCNMDVQPRGEEQETKLSGVDFLSDKQHVSSANDKKGNERTSVFKSNTVRNTTVTSSPANSLGRKHSTDSSNKKISGTLKDRETNRSVRNRSDKLKTEENKIVPITGSDTTTTNTTTTTTTTTTSTTTNTVTDRAIRTETATKIGAKSNSNSPAEACSATNKLAPSLTDKGPVSGRISVVKELPPVPSPCLPPIAATGKTNKLDRIPETKSSGLESTSKCTKDPNMLTPIPNGQAREEMPNQDLIRAEFQQKTEATPTQLLPVAKLLLNACEREQARRANLEQLRASVRQLPKVLFLEGEDTDDEGSQRVEYPSKVKTIRGVDPSTHFENVGTLGRGKFGHVVTCREKCSGKMFASKTFRTTRLARCNGELMEVAVLRAVGKHPQIAFMHAAYENGTQCTIVTELVSGGALYKRIQEEGTLDEAITVGIIRQVLLGLRHLQTCQVIHCDLKPENLVMRKPRGYELKIIDFGLACFYKPPQAPRPPAGTLNYLAPETQNYDPQSYATDLWSVAVIAYEILSGITPFEVPHEGDPNRQLSSREILLNITQVRYNFDDEGIVDVSKEAKDFIKRILVRDPKKRPTVHECLDHPWIAMPDTKRSKITRTVSLRRHVSHRMARNVGARLPIRASSLRKCEDNKPNDLYRNT